VEVSPRIRVVKGNILTAHEGYIVHGCNAEGKMGAGVALQIRNKWPQAYASYRKAFTNGRLSLGSISGALVSDRLLVINAVTQPTWGRDRVCRVHYPCVHAAFASLVQMACVMPELERIPAIISFPLIGCGLAGGKWELVEPQILSAVPHYFELRLYLRG